MLGLSEVAGRRDVGANGGELEKSTQIPGLNIYVGTFRHAEFLGQRPVLRDQGAVGPLDARQDEGRGAEVEGRWDVGLIQGETTVGKVDGPQRS
jgi:hypothetical protein